MRAFAEHLKRAWLPVLIARMGEVQRGRCTICLFSERGRLRGYSTEPIPHPCTDLRSENLPPTPVVSHAA